METAVELVDLEDIIKPLGAPRNERPLLIEVIRLLGDGKMFEYEELLSVWKKMIIARARCGKLNPTSIIQSWRGLDIHGEYLLYQKEIQHIAQELANRELKAFFKGFNTPPGGHLSHVKPDASKDFSFESLLEECDKNWILTTFRENAEELLIDVLSHGEVGMCSFFVGRYGPILGIWDLSPHRESRDIPFREYLVKLSKKAITRARVNERIGYAAGLAVMIAHPEAESLLKMAKKLELSTALNFSCNLMLNF